MSMNEGPRTTRIANASNILLDTIKPVLDQSRFFVHWNVDSTKKMIDTADRLSWAVATTNDPIYYYD